jgi:hypothetical protein
MFVLALPIRLDRLHKNRGPGFIRIEDLFRSLKRKLSTQMFGHTFEERHIYELCGTKILSLIKGPFGRASAVAKTAVAVATLIKWLLW